jgi:hypothetical protein
MEHDVYLCSWKRSRKGFTLWVIDRPTLRAEGSSYAEAEERFLDAIRSAGGAMQAVLEFQPPLPKTALAAKYSVPELYLIGGDGGFQADAPHGTSFDPEDQVQARLSRGDQFFTSPICRTCLTATGPRNDKPLRLNRVESRFDGAFGRVLNDCQTSVRIVSAAFVDLLASEERDRLDLRPTERERRGKAYFELAGPAGPAFVAVSGLPVAGWRCDACGYRTFGHYVPEVCYSWSFVAADDLPDPVPPIFVVGIPPEVRQCITADRWRELMGRKGTRGFVSMPLGVAPARETIRRPDLPKRGEARASFEAVRRARRSGPAK